jgi:hypothetical protein
MCGRCYWLYRELLEQFAAFFAAEHAVGYVEEGLGAGTGMPLAGYPLSLVYLLNRR